MSKLSEIKGRLEEMPSPYTGNGSAGETLVFQDVPYLLNLVERLKEIVEQIHYDIGSVDREVTDDILRELGEQ